MIIAFHGEPSLKQAVMDRLYEHKRLEQIIQGVYWEQGRGCHLGCITHANDNWHAAAERLFGIEQRIGYWLEAVFENLPKDECARWVIESTKSIPCGADISKCHHHFLSWLLLESDLLKVTPGNRKAIETVGYLHRRAIVGVVTSHEWEAAVEAASAVEEASAVQAAAEDWRAAVEAAAAARSALPPSAVRSAAAAAAWSKRPAARAEAWRKIAATSIEIFAAAPVVPGSIASEIERELCCRNLWCREGSWSFELAGAGNG